MTWYIVSCGIMAMSLLLYELFFIVKSLWYVMIGLRSNGYLVTSAPCLNKGHSYNFVSSVGHLKSDLVGLLVYDGTCTYLGHRCCITGPSGQRQAANHAKNELISWVDHVELYYIWHDSCYKHVLYLCCIHDHFIKWEIIITFWCMWVHPKPSPP
jgi:hypothetical protein